MYDRIQTLIERGETLRNQDVSHPELGTTSGFHEAEAGKNALLDYLLRILRRAEALVGEFNETVLETRLSQVESALSVTESTVANITETIGRGIHNPQFPNERQSYIDTAITYKRQFEESLHPFELSLSVAELERQMQGGTNVAELEREARERLSEVRAIAAEAAKARSALQNSVMTKSLAEAGSSFQSLAMDHSRRESYWFAAFVIACIGAAGAVLYLVFAPIPVGDPTITTVAVIRRLLLLSAAGIMMRVTLVKYNVERNLRLIYTHRNAVLTQYKLFEAAIGELPESAAAKNQFRLEIAKVIFADPTTGYIAADSGSEININPVVSTIEKVTGA
jgi:hypothetical protein